MACRGVHFAISEEQAQRLLAAKDDEALVGIVQDEIEAEWELAYETDKAWDALHRCLSNGTLNSEGEPPLSRVFFGGRTLNENDDYFVVLTTPAEVTEIAKALGNVTDSWLRSRYFGIPFPDYQSEKSDEDWEYTVSNFRGLPDFFARAAGAGRYVIFTVDQ
jgi:hypothetical protein